jgi:hypothetical protein
LAKAPHPYSPLTRCGHTCFGMAQNSLPCCFNRQGLNRTACSFRLHRLRQTPEPRAHAWASIRPAPLTSTCTDKKDYGKTMVNHKYTADHEEKGVRPDTLVASVPSNLCGTSYSHYYLPYPFIYRRA